MNFNASIIDQRLTGIKKEFQQQAQNDFDTLKAGQLKSLAFVYLCVKTMLDLSAEESFDCLTDGVGDCGVDAMYLIEEMDGEFGVTLFQGKYKTSLEGNSILRKTASRHW